MPTEKESGKSKGKDEPRSEFMCLITSLGKVLESPHMPGQGEICFVEGNTTIPGNYRLTLHKVKNFTGPAPAAGTVAHSDAKVQTETSGQDITNYDAATGNWRVELVPDAFCHQKQYVMALARWELDMEFPEADSTKEHDGECTNRCP